MLKVTLSKPLPIGMGTYLGWPFTVHEGDRQGYVWRDGPSRWIAQFIGDRTLGHGKTRKAALDDLLSKTAVSA